MTASRDELLAELHPTAFAIAYRMLGSVAEAEDVVQETLLRVHRALEEGETISSPRAYAATIATRLAIDELRSARARRETYVGEWLPEPIVTEAGAIGEDPARAAEMADSLSMAFLVVLETLSSRAARGPAAARRVRLPVRGDRADRRQVGGQRPPARGAGAPPGRGASPTVRDLPGAP